MSFFPVQRQLPRINTFFVLFQFLIDILSFCSFSVDISSPSDRLSVTLTLLLTAVAFKFVVSQSLPTISYLTLLVSWCPSHFLVTFHFKVDMLEQCDQYVHPQGLLPYDKGRHAHCLPKGYKSMILVSLRVLMIMKTLLILAVKVCFRAHSKKQ